MSNAVAVGLVAVDHKANASVDVGEETRELTGWDALVVWVCVCVGQMSSPLHESLLTTTSALRLVCSG